MAGLVSILDETHFALVEELWKNLKTDCGLQGIYVTPLPHFSWQVAESYQWDALEIILHEIASAAQTIQIKTNSLALFTAESPVVYIPVVRTKELSEIHELIWEKLTPISMNSNLYYGPSHWTPHITLAYRDVDMENLSCLMEKLAFHPIYWEIEIDNLTLIDDPEGASIKTRYQIKLGEKDSS